MNEEKPYIPPALPTHPVKKTHPFLRGLLFVLALLLGINLLSSIVRTAEQALHMPSQQYIPFSGVSLNEAKALLDKAEDGSLSPLTYAYPLFGIDPLNYKQLVGASYVKERIEQESGIHVHLKSCYFDYPHDPGKISIAFVPPDNSTYEAHYRVQEGDYKGLDIEVKFEYADPCGIKILSNSFDEISGLYKDGNVTEGGRTPANLTDEEQEKLRDNMMVLNWGRRTPSDERPGSSGIESWGEISFTDSSIDWDVPIDESCVTFDESGNAVSFTIKGETIFPEDIESNLEFDDIFIYGDTKMSGFPINVYLVVDGEKHLFCSHEVQSYIG